MWKGEKASAPLAETPAGARDFLFLRRGESLCRRYFVDQFFKSEYTLS